MTTPQTHVPTLDSDAGRPLSEREQIERRVVASLIAHLARAGFRPCAVWDGGEIVEAVTPKQVMEAVFSVDDSNIHFRSPRAAPPRVVCIVLGNGPDAIADWTYGRGDPDGFDAAMNAFFEGEQWVVYDNYRVFDGPIPQEART